MGTRHWPSDADDEVERLERRIKELEAELTTSRKEWNSLLETAEARLDAVEDIVEQWWESSMSDDVAMVAIKAALEQK